MQTPLSRALAALNSRENPELIRVPDGFDAMVVADLARGMARQAETRPLALTFVARDGQRQQRMIEALAFTAPDIEAVSFPAWDCQPYDRVSPTGAVTAQRMTALAQLVRTRSTTGRPRVLVTSVNAVSQRTPPVERVRRESFSAAPGNVVSTEALIQWLEINGFLRSGTVRDSGEYAVRGGIVDLFPPGAPNPVRLDFFGDVLESIRGFDAESQRSVGQMRSLNLVPMSEVHLTTENIKRFRQGYVARFGVPGREDRLYEAISDGRRFPGLEHWMPLFSDSMGTLFDFTGDAPLVFDALVDNAVAERQAQIRDYFDARQNALKQALDGVSPYHPLAPEALYLMPEEWAAVLKKHGTARLSPFRERDGAAVIDCAGRRGRSFSAERSQENINVFSVVVEHIHALIQKGLRVVVGAWTPGSRERLTHVLADHGLTNTETVGRLADALALDKGRVGMAVWGLEAGFEVGDLVLVSEQDILGDRLVRQGRKNRRAQDFLTEVTGLMPEDLVVHIDHGIARFAGLKTIEALGAPHDCLELHYAGGDKLFLPVENIELLSRYGSEGADVQLDKLGGAAWQARKSRMKERLMEMASALMKIAAERILKEAPRMVPPDGLYDEFAARFPYDETEDQQSAIDAVLDDMGSGKPMDRLVCGDVGFGKTEVALRAAFNCAMAAKQVAVVTPTTLLARQHYRTFVERFAGLPVRIAHASRFVPAAELKKVKEGLADGGVDIVIGTHALLGKNIRFKDLGLVVVDEEQHFGVAHKERLKELRAEVHILTLSATPIPRTLQLALTGVRELSLIATPPVDRLAVRTFVTPFDPLPIREALLRERYRGGQSFYVAPRIEDLAGVQHFLELEVPEAKVAVAHGQMPAGRLDDIMTAFYDGKYDI
ncbi:MAG: DEAD/DEAH box helicase, partial [Methylobacteriaceae bacterium]|nr:DEAD/DEAH box helicase [Methylobacteriaceae bacterium]